MQSLELIQPIHLKPFQRQRAIETISHREWRKNRTNLIYKQRDNSKTILVVLTDTLLLPFEKWKFFILLIEVIPMSTID